MLAWVKGLFWTVLGIAAVVVFYFVSMFVVGYTSMILMNWINNMAEDEAWRELAMLPVGLFFGVSFFWVVLRFVFPSLFGILKLSGLFLHRCGSVSFEAIYAVITKQFVLMRNDLGFATKRFKSD